MEVYEISPAVNACANDTPDLLEPYTAADEPAPPPKAEAVRKRGSPTTPGRARCSEALYTLLGTVHILPVLRRCAATAGRRISRRRG